MRTVVGAAALLLVATGICLPAPGTRRATPAKPGDAVGLARINSRQHWKAPVTIQVVPGPVVGSGRQRVRVVVTPGVDADQVTVEVATHDGVSIAQGRRQWQIPGRAQAPASEELIVATTGPGERCLVVTATLSFKGGTQVTGVAALALNSRGKTARPIPGSRVVPSPQGGKILEIPAEEAPAQRPASTADR